MGGVVLEESVEESEEVGAVPEDDEVSLILLSEGVARTVNWLSLETAIFTRLRYSRCET
jgi:hypothetical protein